MGRDEGARKKEERPALVPKLRMINQILMVRFLNEIKIWHLIYILGFGIQPPPLSGAQKRKVFFFFFGVPWVEEIVRRACSRECNDERIELK